MPKRSKLHDGDERLSNYVKKLRPQVRKPVPPFPEYKHIIRETWEQIYLLGKRKNAVPKSAITKVLPFPVEKIEAVLWALEKAGKIKIDREAKLIWVVFPENTKETR